MATKKFTLLINWGETAGWTETFYRFGTGAQVNDTQTISQATAIVNARALVLTPFATIVGVRASAVDAPKIVQLIKFNTKGQNTGTFTSPGPDIVNVAILATMSSSAGGKRKFLQRGLIDNDVVNGQITLASSGVGIFTTWFNFLGDGSFRIRDLVPGPNIGIDNINGATGVLTKTVAGDVNVGDLIVVKTRVAGGGKRVYWTGTVKLVDGVAITLNKWTWGNCTGGTFSVNTVQYGAVPAFTVPFPQRARTRQTGRPFDLLRGRQAKR